MKQNKDFAIGICSWSLNNELSVIESLMEETGLTHIHLGVAALLDGNGAAFREALAKNRWTISCTMLGFPQEDYSTLETIKSTGGIMPDDCWKKNRLLALEAIDVTSNMSVSYLSLHAGFIDPADQEGYEKFCDRMFELADVAQARNVTLLLETGQESAEELRDCLEDLNHPAIGVNFDPANMILYGKGDPIQAVRVLAPWVHHVHIKDATASLVQGEWGHNPASPDCRWIITLMARNSAPSSAGQNCMSTFCKMPKSNGASHTFARRWRQY